MNNELEIEELHGMIFISTNGLINHIMDSVYDKEKKNAVFEGKSYFNEVVCTCKISTNQGRWVISYWHTEEKYQHRGYGKELMKSVLKEIYLRFGEPEGIEYIWNGLNQYVFDWLEQNFDAKCKCDIAVQKNQSDDDWESHIYVLNKDKFMNFFNIRSTE